MNRQELIQLMADGLKPDFHLFWHGPLSQWYSSPFTINGRTYLTAEHWMMAEKARMFNDTLAEEEIFLTVKPSEAKKIGRNVRNYNDEKWASERYDVVVRGNIYKFSQNEKLQDILMDTGDQILVEASPRDTIWGIGLVAEEPDALDPNKWKGQNLLGFALMDARDHIDQVRKGW